MSTKLIGPVLQYTCSFVKYKQPITSRHSLFMKEIGLILICEATSTSSGVIIDVRTSTATNLDYVVLIVAEGFDTKTTDTLSNDKTRSQVFPFISASSFGSTSGSKSPSDIGLRTLDIDDNKTRIKFSLTIKLDSISSDDAKVTGSGTCFEAYEEILSTFEDVTLVGTDGEVKVKKDLLRVRSSVFASLLEDADERQVNSSGHKERQLDDHMDSIDELDHVLNENDIDGMSHVLKPKVHMSANETRIEVTDFKRKVLLAFVKFIKTDRIGNASGIAMDLFMMGQRFNVPLLKTVAGKFMITDAGEEDKERVFELIYNHEPTLLKELYYAKVNQVAKDCDKECAN